MPDSRFNYRGPATIGGVHFADVALHEEQKAGGLTSWSGRTTAPANADMSAQFLNDPQAEIVLPDGRTGTVFLSPSFDGNRWTVDLLGTGPAPGAGPR